jgi:predicted MPP superfamily phosphohydrolase
MDKVYNLYLRMTSSSAHPHPQMTSYCSIHLPFSYGTSPPSSSDHSHCNSHSSKPAKEKHSKRSKIPEDGEQSYTIRLKDLSYPELPVLARESSVSAYQTLRIVCVSDTHNKHHCLSSLPACDIFIHAGDILFKGRKVSQAEAISSLRSFNEWLATVPAKHRFVIAGNHDAPLEELGREAVQSILTNAHYLCNTYIEVMGLRIFGTPYSLGASCNRAFQSDRFRREVLTAVEAISRSKSRITTPSSSSLHYLVQDDPIDSSERLVDILITHGPNHMLTGLLKPVVAHVWGHVHEYRGLYRDAAVIGETVSPDDEDGLWTMKKRCSVPPDRRVVWLSVCSCILNHAYVPEFLPITIDLPVLKQQDGDDTTCLTALTSYDDVKEVIDDLDDSAV